MPEKATMTHTKKQWIRGGILWMWGTFFEFSHLGKNCSRICRTTFCFLNQTFMWFYRGKKKHWQGSDSLIKLPRIQLHPEFWLSSSKKIFFEVLAAQQKDLATIPRRCPRISVAYGSICLRRLGDLYLRQQEGLAGWLERFLESACGSWR